MFQKLYKRNGHYYFRQWIPLDLRSHFGSKTDITKSLKTNDKNQAIMHGSALHQQFNLVFMGYGGSRVDAGSAIGKSGDGGIDGIIKEDRLGLDAIYVQAKRWENPVGRPDIQKFAGALQGHRAKKGVFITTSSYTKEAHDYVSKIDSKIVLMDGAMLSGLMIDNNVGVSPSVSYELKRIDSDYYVEE